MNQPAEDESGGAPFWSFTAASIQAEDENACAGRADKSS